MLNLLLIRLVNVWKPAREPSAPCIQSGNARGSQESQQDWLISYIRHIHLPDQKQMTPLINCDCYVHPAKGFCP